MTQDPITVIILSRNRPLYLWACLDSLYSYTRHPARFVLVDNASDDPGVRDVVRGFERRGMFDVVEWHDRNDPKRAMDAIRRHGDGDRFVYVESDVMITHTAPCWLSRMSTILTDHPELGYLGSYVDQRDFVAPEDGPDLLPGASEAEIAHMLKSHSPERGLPRMPPRNQTLIDPFNPPGRLLMVRTSILPRMVFGNDGQIYRHAKAQGIGVAITPRVKHRHLSLLNVYDYPDYDTEARNRHRDANTDPVPM
ncbi:MAG: glycosyltransferase family A protein [Pseudomonadota bacterium]